MKEKDREIRLLILGLDNAGKTTILQRFLGEDINDISPTVGFNIKTIQYRSKTSQLQQTSSSSSSSLSMSDEGTYNISIWDIGGQSTIRSFWSNYFSNTDGLIWVIDSTDISRFDICIETLKQVLQQDRLAGTSLLILANKLDVPFAYTLEQIAQLLGLQTMVHTITIPVNDGEVENDNNCNTINNDNIDEKQLSSITSSTTIPKPTTSISTSISQSSSIISTSSHHWFVYGCSALTNTGINEAFDALIQNIIHRIYSINQ